MLTRSQGTSPFPETPLAPVTTEVMQNADRHSRPLKGPPRLPTVTETIYQNAYDRQLLPVAFNRGTT